ncbi:hypothetical protein [Ferruginibacter sp.]|uniref:hypothetical protein n=1 Tax=Ferruginibacter sp. TaxID=1940288 RepID=UPI0026592638|nr:hypothetical protein [Ferruginibacter sp.]
MKQHDPALTGCKKIVYLNPNIMIRQLEILSKKDRDILFKAPVLLSVLASVSSNEVKINKSQKADAIKLAHLKTFTAMPILLSYYAEVEKEFKEAFEEAIQKYFPFDDAKRNELKKEMEKVSLVINKLDKEYAQALGKSFERYATHVKKAAHSIFQDFIFPIPIEGLSYTNHIIR